MPKRLQIVRMVSLTAISFLSVLYMIFAATPVRAQTSAPPSAPTNPHPGAITPTIDESGRKIYVNDEASGDGTAAASRLEASAPGRSPLAYWSVTEHRFKPVPTSGAVMRAARSAASEVNTYLDR